MGIAGAIISTTNVENILQLDLLATDFFRNAALPSYLYYNPNAEAKEVAINVGDQPIKIYDATLRAFVNENVTGNVKFTIPKEQASVLVWVPQDATISEQQGKLYANGVVIDYHYTENSMPKE